MKPFRLTEQNLPLPRGTEVVLRVDLVCQDGTRHKKGSAARVDVGHHHTYELVTPAGGRLVAQRDQLTIQKRQVAERLLARAVDFAELADRVIYRAVVGSVAWGLAGPDSDVDRRGVFLLPFDRASSLFGQPDEIQDPARDTGYWEVEKLLHLLLRSDAHAIELLWSPRVELCTPLAQRLRDRRQAFLSNNVIGSFGRYALSQMTKIENRLAQERDARRVVALVTDGLDSRAALARALAEQRWGSADEARVAQAGQAIDGLASSLFDRGISGGRDFASLLDALRADPAAVSLGDKPYRPKNAYNLIRLLHSGVRLLETGEPLIEVSGGLRDRLLEIKRGEVPVEEVIAEGRALGQRLEETADGSVLPDEPPYALADELLRGARAQAAREHLGLTGTARSGAWPVRPDGQLMTLIPAEVWQFLVEQYEAGMLQLALVGAHAYGFPSPDSDLDLKGIHAASASELLGLGPVTEHRDVTEWLGGVETDFTTLEARRALRLLLRGDGNVLERLCSPLQLMEGPAVDRLRELGLASVGTHFAKHYRGYLGGVLRELARQGGQPRVKTLLYAHRVALTGTHLLRTGEMVLDVNPLAERYGYPGVAALVAAKTREKATLDGPVDPELPARLEAELALAVDESRLPEAAPNVAEVDAFLVTLRG